MTPTILEVFRGRSSGGNGILLAAPVMISILLLIALFAIVWARRLRGTIPQISINPNEQELINRVAIGDEAAAEALRRLADGEMAGLKRRAATDRAAALRYRDRIRERLGTLGPLYGQLAAMNLEEGARNDIERRIAAQQAEALRELAWVESRLERRRH